MIRKSLTLFGAALWLAGPLAAAPRVVEIMNFSTNDPAAWEETRRERSEARPLTLEEIQKLIKAGVKERSLVRMIRSRKTLASPTGEALAALKAQGASDRVIEAISTYALPENRHIHLLLVLDIVTPYSLEKAPYLYVGLVHEKTQTQEDLLADSLSRVLGAQWKVDEIVDTSDPMLPTKIRRIQMTGPVRAIHHGKSSFKILLSRRPGITDLTDTARLKPEEVSQIKTVEFDYPAVSLQNHCQLNLELGRDPVMADQFQVKHQRLRCFWD
jgi:hypothetical protein